MEGLQIVTREQFGVVQCDFYERDNQIWMTREQIGAALDYADPQKAIDNIHARHADRLNSFSVTLKVRATDGKAYDTVVYSPKGVYEICRWSRQPKANAFYDWVYDILEKLRTKEATMIDSGAMTQIMHMLAESGRMMVDILAGHEARIAHLEQKWTNMQAGPNVAVTHQLTLATPDQPTKILAAIYKWALRYQHHFYGRHEVEDVDCWGRWDRGDWKYLSFYPDKIRYLIGLHGGEPDQTLRSWRDRGWLETNSERKRFTKTVRLGSIGPVRLVSIKRHALGRAKRAIRG